MIGPNAARTDSADPYAIGRTHTRLCRFLIGSPTVARIDRPRHYGVMKQGRSWLQLATYDLSRIVVRFLGWLLLGLKQCGVEKFPTDGGALVCSNHQSYFDPVLVGAICNRRMNYLARENLFDTRFFGALIRWYDAIPVKHDGMSISGLKETLKRLKRDELVLIFPEGTRTQDGKVAPLKSGFCMLARKAKVPLVPVGISGAFEVWPRDKRWPRLSKVCLEAGEPISPERVADLSDDEIVSLLETRIRACFESATKTRLANSGV